MAEQSAMEIVNEGLGSLVKDPAATADYSKEVAEAVAAAKASAARGAPREGLDQLLALEKTVRQACDARSNRALCCAAIDLQRTVSTSSTSASAGGLAGGWGEVHALLKYLSSRRAQLRLAVQGMVQHSMAWLDGEPKMTLAEQRALIVALSELTAGKMFVEVERARLTRRLAGMMEAEGDARGASSLLQELQVETFGGMDKVEKAEYILEQFRVVLSLSDFVRAQIVSRKLNPKLLNGAEMRQVKFRYFDYLKQVHAHNGDCLDAARSFRRLYDVVHEYEAEGVAELPGVVAGASAACLLAAYIGYLCVSQRSGERDDLLREACNNTGAVFEKADLEAVSSLVKLGQRHLDQLCVAFPPPELDEALTLGRLAFEDAASAGGDDAGATVGARNLAAVKARIIEHNLQVMSKVYRRVRLSHLAELLRLSRDEAEDAILELFGRCKAVRDAHEAAVKKAHKNNSTVPVLNDPGVTFYARIDRPADVVVFAPPESQSQQLNKWSTNLEKILLLVDNTAHLIEKSELKAR